MLINKETGKFTTDDPKLANELAPYYANVALLEDNINSYLKEIGLSSVRLDNKDKYNYYVMTSEDKVNMKNIDKYIEIYYKNPDAYDYLIKTESLTAKVMIIASIVAILLLIKIIFNLIFNNKNIHLEIKVLKRLFFVLRWI